MSHVVCQFKKGEGGGAQCGRKECVNDITGKWSRYLQDCGAVPQTPAPPLIPYTRR